MCRFLFGIPIVAMLLATVGGFAAPESSTDIRATQGELRMLEKDVSNIKEHISIRLDAQDKRVGDLSQITALQANHIAAVGTQTTYLGYLITFVAFVAGLVTYLSATRRAKAEAEAASKQWFEEKANSLLKRIEELESEALRAREAIDVHSRDVKDHADRAHRDMDAAAATVLSRKTGADRSEQGDADASAAITIREASEALKSKAENDFSPDDHFARGLDEYLAGRFDSALAWFDKGLAVGSSGPCSNESNAKLLHARAVTLGQLGRHEEAIVTCDKVDQRYGSDNAPALREQVARALFNKSVTFGQLGRHEDEIATYDEVDRRYGSDNAPALREEVACALRNKSVTLGRFGRHECAIATCDEVDRRYGTDNAPPLREEVATTLVNKGGWLSETGRASEAIAVFDEIERRFGADDHPSVWPVVDLARERKGRLGGGGHDGNAGPETD